MPNGKPGDAPWSDFFVHGRDTFPHDIAQMLRVIHSIDPNLIRHLARPDMARWEQGKDLDQGRMKLAKIMAEQGISGGGNSEEGISG